MCVCCVLVPALRPGAINKLAEVFAANGADHRMHSLTLPRLLVAVGSDGAIALGDRSAACAVSGGPTVTAPLDPRLARTVRSCGYRPGCLFGHRIASGILPHCAPSLTLQATDLVGKAKLFLDSREKALGRKWYQVFDLGRSNMEAGLALVAKASD